MKLKEVKQLNEMERPIHIDDTVFRYVIKLKDGGVFTFISNLDEDGIERYVEEELQEPVKKIVKQDVQEKHVDGYVMYQW